MIPRSGRAWAGVVMAGGLAVRLQGQMNNLITGWMSAGIAYGLRTGWISRGGEHLRNWNRLHISKGNQWLGIQQSIDKGAGLLCFCDTGMLKGPAELGVIGTTPNFGGVKMARGVPSKG